MPIPGRLGFSCVWKLYAEAWLIADPGDMVSVADCGGVNANPPRAGVAVEALEYFGYG
jgi:hypothetical protein